MKKAQETEQINLAADMEWLFPEYAFEDIDPQTYQGVIIERVLERGTWKQVRWLFSVYGEEQVANWVRRHGFRLLSKRSFAFWRLVLNITEINTPDWAIQARENEAW
jgi:hypothetical protein